MWRRGGRSSALDRAEALLTARRSSGGHGHRGTEDFRPQSSPGERSRFLKKAPRPTSSSQSPVSRTQKQQTLEPRYMSSSQCDPQTATLSKLAKSTSRSHKQASNQAGQGTKAPVNLTSELEMSPTPARHFTETSSELSARSNSEQSQRETRFLKKKAAGTFAAPAVAPTRRAVGIKSRFRAGNPLLSSGCLELKSGRVRRSVDLESDEEEMKKLLGDSLDSSDCSFSGARRCSSLKELRFPESTVALSKQTEIRDQSTVPPHSPDSPSRRTSPFRFTGLAQAHFSPSVLSPSPSPPRISSSPSERLVFSHKAESPQHSLSSPSGCGEVFSLDELFPAGLSAEGPHSETHSTSSEDFKINVMTLDKLAPASNGFTSENTGTKNRNKEEEGRQQQQQQEEVVLDYQSDFESDSSTVQVSEHLQGDGDEDEVLSEVREETLDSDRSHDRKNDDYSTAFSDQSHSRASWTSDRSHRPKPFSRRRYSSSSALQGSWSAVQQLKGRALRDAEVQTQPDAAGMPTLDPTVHVTYMGPGPVVTHAISAERLEDISIFNPAVFVVNQVLKEQLAMTRRFIESSQHLHHSLLQKLEPPNYRYTTLEDTIQNIHERRTPKLTVEEVLQEMRISV
ncbi:uncharacterized protein C19orf44 homolog [Xenentodon cancila]